MIERVLEAGGVARIHLMRLRRESWGAVECVGALDPALPREDKMVLVVSSQYGCPVGCLMCDAGRSFHGSLSADEIHAQIDFLLDTWAGPEAASCPKLKVQFARMGEPSLNPAVIDVICELPARHRLPGLMPCVASVVPARSSPWFAGLRLARDEFYPGGMFQLQLSVQSTSPGVRRMLIPFEVEGLDGLSALANGFTGPGDRKVALNFAVASGVPVEARVLRDAFDPGKCLVKLTPLNETGRAGESGLVSFFTSQSDPAVVDLASSIREAGFDVIVSVGLPVEGENGASCGQLAFAGAAGAAAFPAQPPAGVAAGA